MGFIVMEPADTPPMSGSNAMCVATVLLETGIVPMEEPHTRFVLQAPGGLVAAGAACRDGRAEPVTIRNVPSFADRLDAPLEVEGLGTLSVDTDYGGDSFVMVDARALGPRIAASASEALPRHHPDQAGRRHISFAVFCGPLREGPHGREMVNACAIRPGRIDRSPTGTALSAHLARLAARGLMDVGEKLSTLSIVGSRFLGRIEERTDVAGRPAVVRSVTGRAHITSTHVHTLDSGRPVPSRDPSRRHVAGLRRRFRSHRVPHPAIKRPDNTGRGEVMALSRRTFAAAASALALAAGLAVGGAARAADEINVGILRLTSHSPSIIAKGKGYFADEGLSVTFVPFQAAQPMAVAIASGDIDFGMTAISAGLVSLADKGAVKVIGGALSETDDAEGQKILASRAAHEAGLTSPAALAGRRFGVTTAGSSFHYMAHKIADGEGIDRDAIRIVPLQKVPAVIASLKSGQIDAWSIVPNIANALSGGPDVVEIGTVADYVPGYQVTTVFTSSANVADRRELVERFLAALSRGIDDYNAALVDRTMSEEETAEIVAMVHQYVYADQPLDKADPRIRAFAMRINPGAALNVGSVADQFEWFRSEGLVPESATLDDLLDTSFVATN